MLVRAVVDVEESEDGNIYNIMFGHTALGSHAIDIFYHSRHSVGYADSIPFCQQPHF